MNKNNSPSKKSEIRNLLLVVGFGIGFAILLAFLGVYYFGPSGRYVVRNVLLEPSIAKNLNYNDYNPKTNGNSRFVFDKLEFSHYNKQTSKWEKNVVNFEQYQKFYELIAGNKSLRNVSEETTHLFRVPPSATLILYVHTESNAGWQEARKNFQQIDFLDKSGYYRIELHEDSSGAQWAYFYNPDIYQKALELFVPQPILLPNE